MITYYSLVLSPFWSALCDLWQHLVPSDNALRVGRYSHGSLIQLTHYKSGKYVKDLVMFLFETSNNTIFFDVFVSLITLTLVITNRKCYHANKKVRIRGCLGKNHVCKTTVAKSRSLPPVSKPHFEGKFSDNITFATEHQNLIIHVLKTW